MSIVQVSDEMTMEGDATSQTCLRNLADFSQLLWNREPVCPPAPARGSGPCRIRSCLSPGSP